MKGRLFVVPSALDPDYATLDAAGARHLRALRLTAGDALCAIVGPGRERLATITALTRDQAVLRLGDELPVPIGRDPRSPRVLALALGDPARMEVVVEKATELGATEIQPFVAARCQARSLASPRLDRWRRIARAACEQCGRTLTPEIRPCIELGALVERTPGLGAIWLLVPAHAGGPVTSAGDLGALARGAERGLMLVVGPEGGLDEGEVARMIAHGARRLTLGARVLRFETAAITALSVALLHAPD